MGIAYNPKIVTNGLVLCLDAGNTKSVPKTNILTTWVDYAGNQANYEILGPYSIKLKNTTTGWVGYFPAAVSSTGKYVITFTYYSDSDGSSLVLDNDGIMDNAYNTTLTANITTQTYTGLVDVNTTGNILHYFRRNGGGNIYVTNVSYFKLETTWTDLSGNGNNGTLTNGPTYSNANGGSLVFDGTDDYVSVPRNNLLTGTITQFTVLHWVKLTELTKTWNLISSIWNDSGATNDKYMFHFAIQNPYLNLYISSSGDNFTLSAQEATSFTTNAWNMVGFTVNCTNSTVNIYRNSAVVASGSYNFASVPNVTQNFVIANKVNTLAGGSFNGNIVNGLIYNRALSAAEIQQNFNAARGRFGI